MIERANIKVDNWHTEGFECEIVGDEIRFSAGSVVKGESTLSYDAFSFDVEGDEELSVVYDVYLLASGDVDVMRTEIGADTVAFYDGEGEVIHCLTSLEIPKGDSLPELTLTVRNVVSPGVT